MTRLLNLAERCKTAAGPDREIDCLIQEWRFPELTPDMRVMYYGDPTGEHVRDEGQTFVRSPSFTASLDAAMTLVPEGYDWAVFRTNGGLTVHSWCGNREDIFAATPALALCAAALRARAAQEAA